MSPRKGAGAQGGGTVPADAAAADAAMLEAGRLLFARPWRFVMGAPSLDFVPPADGPEIAFAGRSNVGKSSLINALTNRRDLARTSNTPGRTQELNYFRPEDTGVWLTLVDMPGYGYAEAPKEQVERWTRLVFGYLRGRVTLKRVYLLIDARHGVKPNDGEVMDLLDRAAVSYQIVLTKADKPKAGSLEAVIAATAAAVAKRPASYPGIIATSSETGLGIDLLRAAVARTATE
jgi:GTP-binding protein